MKLKVELVWEAEDGASASSIYLTSDGRILLEGEAVGQEERDRLNLGDKALVSVDKLFIDAIKALL